VKGGNPVAVDQSRLTERVAIMETRMLALEKRYDELCRQESVGGVNVSVLQREVVELQQHQKHSDQVVSELKEGWKQQQKDLAALAVKFGGLMAVAQLFGSIALTLIERLWSK
jgi:predicted nuclease with TOPRIM domain